MNVLEAQTNMIIRTTDPEHFKKIFALIPKMEDTPFSVKEFKVWWLKNYDEKNFRVWVEINKEETEVYSFMIAHIVKPLFEDEVFILLTYVDPKSTKCPELLGRAEGWARARGIRKVSAYVSRNPDGFCRKYGFNIGFTEIYKKLDY